MSQWFYAEGNREQRGPLASENLVELFRSGRIALDTLVWREGSGDWQPLGNFVDELGLATVPGAVDEPVSSSGPPPLRPLPPGSPPAHTATAPPRSGLSGCALTAIIVASIGGVLIVVVAVLAAIAMPAYQQYVLRSKTAMVYAQLLPLKTEISAFVLEHERCPVNGDTGFGSPESYAQAGIREIRIGRFEAGHCGLEAWLDLPANAPLHGTAIWLDYDTQSLQWECSAEADDKYLPHECRG